MSTLWNWYYQHPPLGANPAQERHHHAARIPGRSPVMWLETSATPWPVRWAGPTFRRGQRRGGGRVARARPRRADQAPCWARRSRWARGGFAGMARPGRGADTRCPAHTAAARSGPPAGRSRSAAGTRSGPADTAVAAGRSGPACCVRQQPGADHRRPAHQRMTADPAAGRPAGCGAARLARRDVLPAPAAHRRRTARTPSPLSGEASLRRPRFPAVRHGFRRAATPAAGGPGPDPIRPNDPADPRRRRRAR